VVQGISATKSLSLHYLHVFLQLLYLHYVYAMYAKFFLPLFAFDYESVALFLPACSQKTKITLAFISFLLYFTPVAVLAKHFQSELLLNLFYFFMLFFFFVYYLLCCGEFISVSTFAYLTASQSSM